MLLTKKFWKDVLIGTIFIFAFMWFASKFLAIFNFLDPIGEALGDMKITDQVFSNPYFRPQAIPEDRVTIINFGRRGRGDIAQMINIVNKYNPKVIGIDTFFSNLKEDSLSDLILAEALSNVDNLVLGTKFLNPGDLDDPYFYGIKRSHELFRQNAIEAHVVLSAEEAGTQQEEFKVVRQFFPKMAYNDTINNQFEEHVAFGIKLAEFIDPVAANDFLARENEEELINFRGNIFDIDHIEKTKYSAIDWMDVLNEDFDPSLITDKIILFGMVGEYIGEPYYVEDKFFTPMNDKYAGRADEDMFGVVIHANIVSMVLDRDYLERMTNFSSIVAAILLCMFNVVMFSLIYRKLPLWYDGLTKLIQLLQLVVILGIIVLVFHAYSLELELTYGIVAIALAGDSLEVLYGVGYNLFDSKKRKLLFTSKR
jgi:CHASE2 domain-containing sensor protein